MVFNNPMKISKSFHWEMGHRLPHHDGLCRNVHGHSYRLQVDVEGEPDDRGMIVDFYDISRVVKPLLDELDHAFLVDDQDRNLLEWLRTQGMKHVVIPYPSTVENICRMIADRLHPSLATFPTIHAVTLTVRETESASASLTLACSL